MYSITDIIEKKAQSKELTEDEITRIVDAVAGNSIKEFELGMSHYSTVNNSYVSRYFIIATLNSCVFYISYYSKLSVRLIKFYIILTSKNFEKVTRILLFATNKHSGVDK